MEVVETKREQKAQLCSRYNKYCSPQIIACHYSILFYLYRVLQYSNCVLSESDLSVFMII